MALPQALSRLLQCSERGNMQYVAKNVDGYFKGMRQLWAGGQRMKKRFFSFWL
jgi:hypothetical protein